VGIHSGTAIAGIIGHKTFQYDLCGDAVNTAARMCSYSKPGHVNISETTYQLLRDRFGAVPRGGLEIKGKGKMNTYYLLNMPVEETNLLEKQQQNSSGKPNAPKVIDVAVVSVVDRWAKRAMRGRTKAVSQQLVSSGLPPGYSPSTGVCRRDTDQLDPSISHSAPPSASNLVGGARGAIDDGPQHHSHRPAQRPSAGSARPALSDGGLPHQKCLTV